jgi:threonine/homoserine/homoserine lactone efflux protein
MWREAGKLEISKKSTETSNMRIAVRAIAINLLNPKLTIFFFAFLPLFISKNSSSLTIEMIMLSVVFMVMTFIIFALYGLLASGISSYLLNSSKAVKSFQQAFAVIFAAFAVKLALSEK